MNTRISLLHATDIRRRMTANEADSHVLYTVFREVQLSNYMVDLTWKI